MLLTAPSLDGRRGPPGMRALRAGVAPLRECGRQGRSGDCPGRRGCSPGKAGLCLPATAFRGRPADGELLNRVEQAEEALFAWVTDCRVRCSRRRRGCSCPERRRGWRGTELCAGAAARVDRCCWIWRGGRKNGEASPRADARGAEGTASGGCAAAWKRRLRDLGFARGSPPGRGRARRVVYGEAKSRKKQIREIALARADGARRRCSSPA